MQNQFTQEKQSYIKADDYEMSDTLLYFKGFGLHVSFSPTLASTTTCTQSHLLKVRYSLLMLQELINLQDATKLLVVD